MYVMENLYKVLGVDRYATQEEIEEVFAEKKAEQQAIMKGAAGTALEEKAANKLSALRNAWLILKNADSRADYDKEFFGEVEEVVQPARAEHVAGFKPQVKVTPAVAKELEPTKPVVVKTVAKEQPKRETTSSETLQTVTKRDNKRPIEAHPLLIASVQGEKVFLYPKMANRHGLIAGATGTGKTVTLKVLAERFSDIGVPVFLADIKGDVWTMCQAGAMNAGLTNRIDKKLNIKPISIDDTGVGVFEQEVCNPKGYPLRYWDVYGEKGHPVRTTVSAMGPELLARLLELNETQAGVLNIIFRYADDNGYLILDMKDLRTMVTYCSDNAKELQNKYGNISAVSVGAIQRALLRLEDAGGNIFFGEPALDLNDWFAYEKGTGRGVINLLHCAKLFQKPILYSTFLLWMLAGLYDMLPEKGDADKPEMVFFFDEAHLIFKDAPKSLLDKVEQIVRLIRSKGVGVYFISQLPADIPNSVLSQLGNKVQHALRAYTPKDQLALKSAAQSFVANPQLGNLEKVLGELGTGEALVSFMGEDGKPSKVQRGYIMPPNSTLDVLDESLRMEKIEQDKHYGDKYKEVIDRESAYEMLQVKIDEARNAEEQAKIAKIEEAEKEKARKIAEREEAKRIKEEEREYKRKQAEEEREYKRKKDEDAKRAREEEREYKRQLAEEEREHKRQVAEEEREYKRKQAEEKNSIVNKVAEKIASPTVVNTIMRGIFSMLKK